MAQSLRARGDVQRGPQNWVEVIYDIGGST